MSKPQLRLCVRQISFIYDASGGTPYFVNNMMAAAYEITEGEAFGSTETISDEPIDRDAAIAFQHEHGGDGEFFDFDDDDDGDGDGDGVADGTGTGNGEQQAAQPGQSSPSTHATQSP